MRSNMYAKDHLLSVLNIQAVNGECAACESGGLRELDAWSQEMYTKGRHPISMYNLYREVRQPDGWYPDKVSRRGIIMHKVCVFRVPQQSEILMILISMLSFSKPYTFPQVLSASRTCVIQRTEQDNLIDLMNVAQGIPGVVEDEASMNHSHFGSLRWMRM